MLCCDFLNYIEIHAVSEKGIPMHAKVHTLIHERILNGILSACNFLHHEDTKLDLAFLCPHAHSDNERKCHCNKSCDELSHPALVLADNETMRCLYVGKCYRLLDKHKVWLSKSADGLNAYQYARFAWKCWRLNELSDSSIKGDGSIIAIIDTQAHASHVALNGCDKCFGQKSLITSQPSAEPGASHGTGVAAVACGLHISGKKHIWEKSDVVYSK